MKVVVSPEIGAVCPEFVGACIEASVVNTPYCEPLWQEIEQLGNRFRQELTTETLKDMTSIAATRRIYKACGKDPSRYRPASEALIRRLLQGKELYHATPWSIWLTWHPLPTATALAVLMPTDSWVTR